MAPSPRTKKVRQKGVIGAVGAGFVADKMQKGKVGGKQRIADVTEFENLMNPYEMPITTLDVEMAFRYADLNSDGAISQKDFVLSLARVGIEKTDNVAKEYFTYLSPKVKPLKLKHFQSKLEEYSEDFQPWFCRLIVCFIIIFIFRLLPIFFSFFVIIFLKFLIFFFSFYSPAFFIACLLICLFV